MSGQHLTYEGVLEMFREADRRMEERSAEFDREMKERDAEYARRAKITNKKIGDLTGSIGRVIERFQAKEW